MKVLDLFSGIGGFSLGLERAGMETVAFCEIEPFCRRVLAKHWPGVPIYDDVRVLTGKRLSADGITVDLICGGFPCQDISVAGKGAGIEGERSGLWREYARIIGEVRPQYVIVENVSALRSRGLGRVLGDLASLGYDAEWHCIPASAVGAPHQRDRLWIVGFTDSYGREEREQTCAATRHGCPTIAAGSDAVEMADTGCVSSGPGRTWRFNSLGEGIREQALSDTIGEGLEGCTDITRHLAEELASVERGGAVPNTGRDEAERYGSSERTVSQRNWWQSEPDVGGTFDGFSSWLDGLDMTHSHKLLFAYGNAKKERPAEILRALRREIGTPDDWRSAGGSQCVSPQEILFTYLCQLEATATDETWIQLACTKAFEIGLRSVRASEKPRSASRRSGPDEQCSPERADTLHTLSRLLAHHSQTAWARYRRENAAAVLNAWRPGWEDGVPRVAHGVSARVDRLRSLGNAVVPQIPEMIGRAIMRTVNVE